MKSTPLTTPGFVLTSLSFGQNANDTIKSKKNKTQGTHQSCITKFDYCLPPDEFNHGNLTPEDTVD
jgi:hypothetical protein